MGEALMVLPASTRSLDGRASTPAGAAGAHRIGRMPFTHPRVFRRSERLRDKLWRLRGVVGAVAAPTLLIALVWMLAAPSSYAPGGGSGGAARLSRDSGGGPADPSAAAAAAAATASGGGGGSGEEVYNIVIDAGSTGSRIHIFKFRRPKGGNGDLQLVSDTFEQLKPGLSAFKDAPARAADSLKPLLALAVKTVPEPLRAATALSLKATAGLRLLPGGKAEAILEAVEALLKTYPFRVGEDAVGIMDGAHEGAYAWLTLNYLLGKLSAGPGATVAAIDLGGGSVQEAFALPEADAAAAPPGYVTKLKAGGRSFSVYVHSYLGFGLMAARARVIEKGAPSTAAAAGAAAGAAPTSHPCFAKGSKLTYSYAGRDYPVGEVVEAGDFKRCAAAALKALDHDKDCGRPKETCSFGGVWRGKPAAMARVYYVSSYFWDRALDAGIIADKAAIEFKTSPAEFARRAAAVCGKDPSEVAKAYGVPEAHAPYFCLDLSFCHTVLTQGFDLPEQGELSLVKQVKYNGQAVEAAWPLGAAVHELSSAAA